MGGVCCAIRYLCGCRCNSIGYNSNISNSSNIYLKIVWMIWKVCIPMVHQLHSNIIRRMGDGDHRHKLFILVLAKVLMGRDGIITTIDVEEDQTCQ